MNAGNLNEIKPDTHSRLRGKEIPSLEEGRAAFAAVAGSAVSSSMKTTTFASRSRGGTPS